MRARRVFDRSFTGLSLISVVLVGGALGVLLVPIVRRGLGAFVFRATVEHRRMLWEQFGRGDAEELKRELAEVEQARAPLYGMLAEFEEWLEGRPYGERRRYAAALAEFKQALRKLLGPLPGEPRPVLPRERYGQTRWDRAREALHAVLYVERYDYSDPTQMGRLSYVPRAEEFRATPLAPAFACLESNAARMLQPRWTIYWRFLFDRPVDAYVFGGIWPAVLGTLYLTIGAVLFAVPMGVISAIYLVEYAGDNWLVGLLRTCISTLAGVPSIVFGLFGLAFFVNTLGIPKSVLAGSLTLGVLILPVVIRAAEEALRAVPSTYKEAALSLGSSKWSAIVRVILPAALPGILTGVVISMGRAAGETAPIIFTAAVSAGPALHLWQTFGQPTPALPWGVYNLCTEHEAVDEIRHVQYGMVLTLVALVLLLNGAAIIMRARIARRLAG